MFKLSNLIIGGLFIIFGVAFLLSNMGVISINITDIGYLFTYFWPLFIIIPGLIMEYSYFKGNVKDAGILVPGGILLTVGLVCQVSMVFNIWHLMWPGFILSVAVGLFQLYYFGNKEKGLLIPVGILGGLSFIFFTTFSLDQLFKYRVSGLIFPIIIIAVGAIILSRGGLSKKSK